MAAEDFPCTKVIYIAAVHKSLLLMALVFYAEILDIILGIMELFLCFFLGDSVRDEMVDDSLL